MQSIEKPDKRVYWVARSENADVLFAGYTDPNQVTSTGQSVLDFGDRVWQVSEISQFRENPEAWNYEWNGELWELSGHDLIYILASTQIAEPLSRSLFSLIYGNENGLYAKVLNHPTISNASCLACKKSDVIPIALAADSQPLSDALQIAVENGSLSQIEIDSIVAAVQTNAGQEVLIADFIPPSWQSNVYTREQLEADGWFANQEII